MTSRDFVYWLQGFFELGAPAALSEAQTTQIKNHLHMVFAHEIDPAMGDEAHQKRLSDIHERLDKVEQRVRLPPSLRDVRIKC